VAAVKWFELPVPFVTTKEMEAVEPGHTGTPEILTLPIVWAEIFAEKKEIDKIDINLMFKNFRAMRNFVILGLIFCGYN